MGIFVQGYIYISRGICVLGDMCPGGKCLGGIIYLGLVSGVCVLLPYRLSGSSQCQPLSSI